MTFINVSGKDFNTIHRMDFEMFEEINEVVQAEPAEGQNPEILGQLASIGIKKGQPFKPDARMKKILAEAADVAAVTVRALTARPRDDMFYYYPGESIWSTCFPGGSHEFLDNGAIVLDARAYFHFYATGITPAMAAKMVGKGSQYAVAYLDSEGNAPRRRQDLQGAPAAERSGQGLLVLHAVRQPDAFHAPDRSAVPGSR